jgi:hypothetical protein
VPVARRGQRLMLRTLLIAVVVIVLVVIVLRLAGRY